MTWQDELRALKLADIKKRTPAAYEASGGDTMKIKPYSDRTANGLTKCIMDYLRFNSHYCNRINTQGQARVHRIPKYSLLSGRIEHSVKVTYTKSMTAKGTADIDSIINGKAVKIEVKIGADRMSTEQVQQSLLIHAAGGLYYVARNMPDFLRWYKKTFVK